MTEQNKNQSEETTAKSQEAEGGVDISPEMVKMNLSLLQEIHDTLTMHAASSYAVENKSLERVASTYQFNTRVEGRGVTQKETEQEGTVTKYEISSLVSGIITNLSQQQIEKLGEITVDHKKKIEQATNNYKAAVDEFCQVNNVKCGRPEDENPKAKGQTADPV